MFDPGITQLVDRLVRFDPDLAERDALGSFLRDVNRVRGWLDHATVRCARRLSELNTAGRSEPAGTALMDEGRRSGKEARSIEDRQQICNEFPALEDALATGDVSSDHLDALSRLTRNLNDVERSDLHAIADDIVASATSDWVSEFERKTRNCIATIRASHSAQDEAAELDRQRAASNMKRWVDKTTGLHNTLLQLDPLRDAALHTAIDAQLARLRQADSANTPFAQLQIDAVIAAVNCDTPGATRIPSVTVHIDAASLCHGRHPDTLSETIDGTPLPVTTVQRLCCEALIDAVIINPDGTINSLCAEQRTATRAQRRALAAMYSTCAHPTCTVGYDHCRIHHITWWSNHGKTVLTNLIPVCEVHHHHVHEGGWQLTMTPDRVTTWTRPDGIVWHTGQSTNRRPQRRRPEVRPPDPPPGPPPKPGTLFARTT